MAVEAIPLGPAPFSPGASAHATDRRWRPVFLPVDIIEGTVLTPQSMSYIGG
jgi:hypothetical protein